MIGDLPRFGIIWYHSTGITNVLLVGKVQCTYRVMYDSAGRNHLHVHSPDRPKFIMSPEGLLYHGMAPKTSHNLAQNGEEEINNKNDHEDDEGPQVENNGGPFGIKTVTRNKAQFSNRDVDRAIRARRGQEILGASLQIILHVVDRKLFSNWSYHPDRHQDGQGYLWAQQDPSQRKDFSLFPQPHCRQRYHGTTGDYHGKVHVPHPVCQYNFHQWR